MGAGRRRAGEKQGERGPLLLYAARAGVCAMSMPWPLNFFHPMSGRCWHPLPRPRATLACGCSHFRNAGPVSIVIVALAERSMSAVSQGVVTMSEKEKAEKTEVQI